MTTEQWTFHWILNELIKHQHWMLALGQVNPHPDFYRTHAETGEQVSLVRDSAPMPCRLTAEQKRQVRFDIASELKQDPDISPKELYHYFMDVGKIPVLSSGDFITPWVFSKYFNQARQEVMLNVTDQDLIDLYLAGVSQSDIARKKNITPHAVRTRLQPYNIIRRNKSNGQCERE